MRRIAALTLLLAGMALPLCAQHGGHGGSSGHASGGFGGASHGGLQSGPSHALSSSGFRPSAAARPSYTRPFGPPMGRPNYAPGGSRPLYRNMPTSQARGLYRDGAQPANDGRGYRPSPYRQPYRRGGLVGYGYLAPYYPAYFYGLGDLGYGWDDGQYDSGDGQAYQQPYDPPYEPDQYNGFDPQGPASYSGPYAAPPQIPPGSVYRPDYGSAAPAPSPTGEPAVTLVFKDHRPDQVIHNYLLNGNTLTVWDQHPHDIPLAQLDVAATEKINHDAGVELFLPGARN